jgi:hypothetical protein
VVWRSKHRLRQVNTVKIALDAVDRDKPSIPESIHARRLGDGERQSGHWPGGCC